MSDRPFVHLLPLATTAALGASKLLELARAKSLGMSAPLTDRGNLYGAVEFLRRLCAEIKTIIGLRPTSPRHRPTEYGEARP